MSRQHMGQVTRVGLSCYLVLQNQVTRQPRLHELTHMLKSKDIKMKNKTEMIKN